MIATDYRAELYYRTDTIGRFDVQQRIMERLEELEKRDLFDRTIRTTWHHVETREFEDRPSAHATYEEFRRWAAANDFSLEPAFDVRPRYVPGTTEVRSTVIFPVVALAIYADDELRAVLPSTDEFGHYTVPEALEGFERGDLDRWLARFAGVTVDRTTPHMEVSATI
jgi:hypothetical protein